MDYGTDWLARRDMISRAVLSQGSKAIKDPVTHVNRMVKKWGSEYREAVGAAYGFRDGHRCDNELCDLVDRELSKRHGWKTIRDIERARLDAIRARRVDQREKRAGFLKGEK